VYSVNSKLGYTADEECFTYLNNLSGSTKTPARLATPHNETGTRDISNIQQRLLLQWGHIDGRCSWNFESLCLHRVTEARLLTPAVGRTVDKSEWATSRHDRFSRGREPRFHWIWAGWAPGPVWRFWRREKSLPATGIRNFCLLTHSLVCTPTALCRLLKKVHLLLPYINGVCHGMCHR